MWTEDLGSLTSLPNSQPVNIACWRWWAEVGAGTWREAGLGGKCPSGESGFRVPPLFPAASFPEKLCLTLPGPLLMPPVCDLWGYHLLHGFIFLTAHLHLLLSAPAHLARLVQPLSLLLLLQGNKQESEGPSKLIVRVYSRYLVCKSVTHTFLGVHKNLDNRRWLSRFSF